MCTYVCLLVFVFGYLHFVYVYVCIHVSMQDLCVYICVDALYVRVIVTRNSIIVRTDTLKV